MLKTYFKRVIAVAVLASAATVVFAENAPVYDADNFPPQFDGQPDSQADSQFGSDQPSQVRTSGYGASQPIIQQPSQASSSMSLDQRIGRVEQQVSTLQQSNSSAKISSLQTEVQSLRGQVEDLMHQLQQMQNQQRSMYSDIDKRLSKQAANKSKIMDAEPVDTTDSSQPKATPDEAIVAKTPVKAAAKLPASDSTKVAPTASKVEQPVVAKTDDATQNQPNAAEEQQIYQTAYNLIKAKKYTEAVATLQKMLQKYPSGQFAANAHYWLGELYGLMGNSAQSAVEFNTIVKNYPDSPKVSDAQLKLGLIYAAAFKWSDAKTAFKKVISHYPGTASARLASEQLKQIKDAGH